MSAAPQPLRADRAGDALALLAAIAFSMKAILAKLAFARGLDPLLLLTARMGLAAPFFAAVWWAPGRPSLSRRDWLHLGLMGLVGYYGAALLDFYGLLYISAGLERLVLYVHPTLVVLLGALWRRVGLERRTLASLGVCYLGLGLAVLGDLRFGEPREVVTGVALVLMSALLYALYLLGAEALTPRVGALRVGALASLLSGAVLATQTGLSGRWGELAALPPEIWGIILAIALGSTVLPILALAAAIARVGPGRASTVGMVGPVSAAILGWAFLGEPITALQIGGGLVVVLGLWVGRRPARAPADG